MTEWSAVIGKEGPDAEKEGVGPGVWRELSRPLPSVPAPLRWLFPGLGRPFLATIHLPPVRSYLSLRHCRLQEAFQDPSQAQLICSPLCSCDSSSWE